MFHRIFLGGGEVCCASSIARSTVEQCYSRTVRKKREKKKKKKIKVKSVVGLEPVTC